MLGGAAAEAHAATQLAPRVAALCCVHHLVVHSSRCCGEQQPHNSERNGESAERQLSLDAGADSLAAGHIAARLWRRLLCMATGAPGMRSREYKLNSGTHRLKVTACTLIS